MVGIAVELAKGPLPLSLLDNTLLDPLFALLIYNMALCEGSLAAFFSLPAMVLLGEASYALYILHYPVHDWLIHVLRHLHPGIRTESPGFFLAYTGLIVGLSMLSVRLVEQPARRAIRQAFGGRSRSRPSVSGQAA